MLSSREVSLGEGRFVEVCAFDTVGERVCALWRSAEGLRLVVLGEAAHFELGEAEIAVASWAPGGQVAVALDGCKQTASEEICHCHTVTVPVSHCHTVYRVTVTVTLCTQSMSHWVHWVRNHIHHV